MSIRAVKKAIRHTRKVLKEWDKAGNAYWPQEKWWLESQTRYALIDPILRALGWDTSEPKECYPEYPRPFGERKYVDYALFRGAHSFDEIGRARVPPDIIIEAKNAQKLIDKHKRPPLTQLQNYVRAQPAIPEGDIAVLTNGRVWRLYRVEVGHRVPSTPTCLVSIEKDSLQSAAEALWCLLAKER